MINFGVTSLASDVWSLGIVALEMAQGRAPLLATHNTKEAVTVIGNYQRGPVFNRSRLTPHFNQFLDACLAVDPRNRSSVEELLQSSFITNRNEVDLARQVNLAKIIQASKRR